MSGPPAQSPSNPGLSPVTLSNGWAIRDVQTNDLGSVAFVGGGEDYGYSGGGVADGVVLVTADGITKLAAIGDPVPGRPGRVFAGFESKSLNNRDDVAFVALTLPAGDSSNCLQIPWPSSCVPGLYLYSGGHIREIAVSGVTAPDTGGRSFVGFASPQLNDKDMIAFWAYVGVDDVGSVIDGYFLFDGNITHKIVMRGENSPLLGTIGHVSSDSFLLSSAGTLTFCTNGIVAQYADGKLRKVLASGDSIPGGDTVPEFDQLVSLSGNREGEVVFETRGVPYEKSGLYLLRRDGQVVHIMSHGDPTPSNFGRGSFSMTYRYRSASLPQTGLSNLNPQINDSGEVLFVSPVTNNYTATGIFLYSGGRIIYLASDGETVPYNPGFTIRLVWTDNFSVFTLLNNISFGPLGEVVFTAWQARNPSDISTIGIFRLTEGTIFPVAVQGDPAPGTGGRFSNVFFPFVASNALGDVLFLSNLSGSSYASGIFRASLPSPEVPNAGFEASTQDGLPENWTTTWTNFGKGEAGEYNSGGQDSFEGKIDLRLHVAAGGGAVFVVSDPIPVSAGTDYFLQCRMRYNLSGGSGAVYFTVIQFDGSGNAVALDETRGVRGDNFWTWQPKRLLIHMASNAAVIRIRFGLIAASESYIDVDAVGGRDSP